MVMWKLIIFFTIVHVRFPCRVEILWTVTFRSRFYRVWRIVLYSNLLTGRICDYYILLVECGYCMSTCTERTYVFMIIRHSLSLTIKILFDYELCRSIFSYDHLRQFWLDLATFRCCFSLSFSFTIVYFSFCLHLGVYVLSSCCFYTICLLANSWYCATVCIEYVFYSNWNLLIQVIITSTGVIQKWIWCLFTFTSVLNSFEYRLSKWL